MLTPPLVVPPVPVTPHVPPVPRVFRLGVVAPPQESITAANAIVGAILKIMIATPLVRVALSRECRNANISALASTRDKPKIVRAFCIGGNASR